MKKFLLCFILLLQLQSYSQEISSKEIDKFTKWKRVQTTAELLKNRFSGYISCAIRSADTSVYFTLSSATFAVGVVGERDPLYFLLDNDSSIIIYPSFIQSSSYSQGLYYSHQYNLPLDKLVFLSKHKLKSIRRYFSDKYADVDIAEKKQNVLKTLCTVFLDCYLYDNCKMEDKGGLGKPIPDEAN